MMVVEEERNTVTGKSRYTIASAPAGGRIQTELTINYKRSWRSRRRAQRICDRYNKRNGWS